MYAVHRIPFKYFSGLSVITLPVVWLLLIYTALQNLVEGANASRWIKIPILAYLSNLNSCVGCVDGLCS